MSGDKSTPASTSADALVPRDCHRCAYAKTLGEETERLRERVTDLEDERGGLADDLLRREDDLEDVQREWERLREAGGKATRACQAEAKRLREAIREHKDGNTNMSLTNLKLWGALDA